MEDKYKLHKNDAFQNVSIARDIWAPTYFRHYLFPFTSTLGRSESVNSLFKKMVHLQDFVLCFVKQYEYIVDTRAKKENQEGYKGEILDRPLWREDMHAFEKQVASFYTRSVFFMFQELLHDSTSCKCVKQLQMQNLF